MFLLYLHIIDVAIDIFFAVIETWVVVGWDWEGLRRDTSLGIVIFHVTECRSMQ